MNYITKELMDDSTSEDFRFSMRCSSCGNQWHGKGIRFSKAGCEPNTEGKRVIFKTLYRREHADALVMATKEATNVFNLCPICGRFVCNSCFLICDDLDMCRDCAARLHEKGSAVESDPRTSPEPCPATGENERSAACKLY